MQRGDQRKGGNVFLARLPKPMEDGEQPGMSAPSPWTSARAGGRDGVHTGTRPRAGRRGSARCCFSPATLSVLWAEASPGERGPSRRDAERGRC